MKININKKTKFQLKNYKAIYKQYSSLYFIMGIDSFENELAGLEVFIEGVF